MGVIEPYNQLDKYITYAGKAHPELSSDNDDGKKTFIVSVVPNPLKGIHVLYEEEYHLAYIPKFSAIKL
jgi:hypothetical protein